MSVEQCARNLNQIDKEIADLEKKLADEFKNEANYTQKINDIEKSINKNTSLLTYNSKMAQKLSSTAHTDHLTGLNPANEF